MMKKGKLISCVLTVTVAVATNIGSAIPVLADTLNTGIVTTQVPQSVSTSHRLAGINRYTTAVAISQKGWSTSDTVIIASGEDYADALTAGPLAKKYNAPILLTSKTSISAEVIAEIVRLQAKNIIIIGREGAISLDAATQLTKAGISDITRIGGVNRYETSTMVAAKLDKPSAIVIVSGQDFPDALSVSSIASKLGYSIILSEKSGLSDSAKKYIATNGIKKAYIVGGHAVLYPAIEKQVNDPVRLAGENRYETNLAVIKAFEGEFNYDNVFVATGNKFADALAGGALASKSGSPMILVGSSMNANTAEYIISKENLNTKILALGGESIISNLIVKSAIDDKATIAVTKNYSSGGTYSNEAVSGSVIISEAGVNLKNITISGDLLIASTIGEGKVDLDNVTVKGKIIINGGGVSSIKLHNLHVKSVEIDKAIGESVGVAIDAASSIDKILVSTNGIVDVDTNSKVENIAVNNNVLITGTGLISSITVDKARVNVDLKATTVGSVFISSVASGSKVSISSATTVANLNANAAVTVSGTGKITKANIGSNGTTIAITPGVTSVIAGVSAIVNGITKDSSNSNVITSVPVGEEIPVPITSGTSTGSSTTAPSTIVFKDATPSKVFGSGTYTNVVTGGNGAGAITYSSGTLATATVDASTGAITIVAPGTTVITAVKAATATHATVTATYTLTITEAPSTIIFTDIAPSKVFGSGTYTNVVTGGNGAGTITYSSGTLATATVDASTGAITIVAPGTTVITAVKAATATHAAVTATYTLTITEAPSTIVFTDIAPSKVFGSGAYTNVVSGDGAGAITYSSGTLATATVDASTGAITIIAPGTTIITAVKAATATHAAVTATYTLTVTEATSTIIFTDIAPSKVFGSGAYTNVVTGGNGAGAITYSSGTLATASVDASTGAITIIAPGTTIITAVKAATATHAAVTATYTLTVTEATSTIIFTDIAPSKVFGSGAYTNVVTGGNGAGAITYSSGTLATATVDASTGAITIVAPGTTVITAVKAATATHAAVTATYTLTITEASSTIVFTDATPSKVFGSGAYTNVVTGGNGAGAITYSSGTLATATVDAATGAITIIAPGTTIITAVKAATATHATVTATYTLTITEASSTIVFTDATPSKVFGSGAYTNVVTGGNGAGAITYSSGTLATATVDAATGAITIIAPGTTIITAVKAATATHATVTATYTLTITEAPSTIVFTDIAPSKVFGSGAYTNVVTGGNGAGTITYSSGTLATATVDASTGAITIVAPGTTIITAVKAATATHAAVTATYTLTVTEAPVTPEAPSVTRDDTLNTVTGMKTAMEYNYQSVGYVVYDATAFALLDFTGNKTLLVRVAAEGINPASAEVVLEFTTNLVSESKTSKAISNLNFLTIQASGAKIVSKTITSSDFRSPNSKSFTITDEKGDIIPVNLWWNVGMNEYTPTYASAVGSAIESSIQDYEYAKYGVDGLMTRPLFASYEGNTLYISSFTTGASSVIQLGGTDWDFFFGSNSVKGVDYNNSANRSFTISDGTKTASINLTSNFTDMTSLVTYLNGRFVSAGLKAIVQRVDDNHFEIIGNLGVHLIFGGTNSTEFFD